MFQAPFGRFINWICRAQPPRYRFAVQRAHCKHHHLQHFHQCMRRCWGSRIAADINRCESVILTIRWSHISHSQFGWVQVCSGACSFRGYCIAPSYATLNPTWQEIIRILFHHAIAIHLDLFKVFFYFLTKPVTLGWFVYFFQVS